MIAFAGNGPGTEGNAVANSSFLSWPTN